MFVALLPFFALGAQAIVAVEYSSFFGDSQCNSTHPDGNGCTRTQAYWRNHHSGGNSPNNDIPWPNAFDLGRSIFSSPNSTTLAALLLKNGVYSFDDTKCTRSFLANGTFQETSGCDTPLLTYHDHLVSNQYNGPCQIAFRQYVAATLNINSGACFTPDVPDALIYLAGLLFSPTYCAHDWSLTPAVVNSAFPNWEDEKDVLDCYNNGCAGIVNGECLPKYGPEHCPIGSFNATLECPPGPNDCLYLPCVGGCTQTQGYWKNHRLSKKRKQSQPWNEICEGQSTFIDSYVAPPDCTSACPLEKRFFFGDPATVGCSPGNYFTLESVLTTANSKGQACLIAGKQIIAAELNHECTQACLPDAVASALAGAKSILAEYCIKLGTTCPSVGLDSSVNTPSNTSIAAARRQLLAHAEILADYNEGDHGPGACSDLDIVTESALAEEDVPAVVEANSVLNIVTLIICAVTALIVLVMFATGMRSEVYGSKKD